MERVGFLGRIMLILMAALLVMIAVTAGLDFVSRRKAPAFASPFPRAVHAAGIIVLMLGANPAQQRQIVRAATNATVRVAVLDAPPVAGPDDIRAPRLERRLRELLGGSIRDVQAYTDPEMTAKRFGTRVGGKMTKAVASLGDGHTLVIQWLDPLKAASFTLLGLPPSLWAGILGFGVSALALVTALREVRPLRALTRSVAEFDGEKPAEPIEEKGAPDIRRLARAVHGMQERSAALLAERSFLIGAISHDLRTYLTRMRLRTETIGDEEARDRMVGDLDAMTQLIDTALAFARGTTSSQHRVSIDLGDIVAAEVEEHRALGQPATLEASYDGDAMIVGDPVALRRVVGNILDNAVKYALSTVTVRVGSAASCARIVIEDDGPGIPEAEYRHVFSPFYRVERSRSRSTGGTGLGLAIARQIVEAHGGTIAVTAAALHGSVFTIELPTVTPRERRPMSLQNVTETLPPEKTG